MTDLIRHAFHGQAVRVLADEHGEPWFVAADLTSILGYDHSPSAIRRLDADEYRQLEFSQVAPNVRTPEGQPPHRPVTVVSESGMYSLILWSQKPQAVPFRRWVTHEVLPSIRRTGSYSVPQSREERLALAVIDAQAMITERDERIAELEPRAKVADELLDASGDMSVADAAKVLTRAAVPVGSTRLFSHLADLGWLYRGGDGRWHVRQSAIETGRMSVLPQTHHHPRTGEVVVDAPQPRVTPKGVAYLLTHWAALTTPRLEVVS